MPAEPAADRATREGSPPAEPDADRSDAGRHLPAEPAAGPAPTEQARVTG